MQTLNCAQGEFQLDRFPLRRKELLRPWDAADEYLLAHCSETVTEPESTLILNDTFGALTLALHRWSPTTVNDSEMARLALVHNAQLNHGIQFAHNFLTPLAPWPECAKLVVLKVPRTLSLLEFQLHRLRRCLTPQTQIVAAGMTREVHRSTVAAFERFLGPTTTSLARKKARLILSTFDPNLDPGFRDVVSEYQVPNLSLELREYPGIFSKGRLDQGTRLLLEHLPSTKAGARIVDLGCGNGVLGLAVARENEQCSVEFIDESHLAVASAKASWTANELPAERATFTVSDGMRSHPGSVDIVLCNPPFHQGRTMGDHVSWGLFIQARRALKSGGELRIVGNRHLGYHTKLKRIFGGCTVIASNQKFVVLSARANPIIKADVEVE